MASLDLAHGLGFVWVLHLSDGHVGQLDPPEDAIDRITSYEDAVEETGRPGDYPITVTETTHPSSIVTPGLAACMSPRLRQKLEAEAKKRLNPHLNPLDDVVPFGLFGVTQLDRKRPMIEGDETLVLGSGVAEPAQPLGYPSIATTIVYNAARLTIACRALGLDEASTILQDEQVQTRLNALARRRYRHHRGEYDLIASLQSQTVERELRTALCNSDHLIQRTRSRLTSYDEPQWKISLCFEKEAQRELVCGAIFEPRGLDSAFADPVHKYYLAWSTEIQPVLDRVDKVVAEIYGENSSGAIIERLHREQADNIFREGRQTTPLLGRLVDICRMWNDTIAGYKVQKLLFADGLETC